MATEHYNWTELDDSSDIDIVADTSAFLSEIDSTLYNIESEVDGDISDIESRLSAAEQEIVDYDDKFPVGTDDIEAAAVTYPKLNSNVFEQIFQGLTIKHFNNEDVTADNQGMVVPDGGTLEGFYIPDLTMLIIVKLFKPIGVHMGGNASASDTGWKLPSYIPRPLNMMQLGITGVNDGGDYWADWQIIKYRPDGCIGPNTQSDSKYFSTFTLVSILRPYIA